MGHIIAISMSTTSMRILKRTFSAIDMFSRVSLRSAWPIVSTAIILVLFPTLVALSGAEGAIPPLQQQFPKALLGRWKVEEVLVDLDSGRRLLYQRNDPRLVGDTFTISADSIVSNSPEARECLLPKVTVSQTTAHSLVATTLAPHGTPGTPPTVKDYELSIDAETPIIAYSISCNPGRFGPAPLPTARAVGPKGIGTWIVALATGNLAVRWYDETILLLKRDR